MNTLTQNTFFRDLTCGTAALAISVVLGLGFVDATAQPYGMHAPHTALTFKAQPGWFGQPEPAVLVD